MKKLLIFLVLVIVVIFLVYSNQSNKAEKKSSKIADLPQNSGQIKSPEEEYIFVPYWTINSDIESTPYEKLIYFGISVNEEGIDKSDPGYISMQEFVANSKGKKMYLTVRMLDSDINLKVLKDTALQEEIITQSVEIANANGFEGLILDFEIQGLPFESFVQSITKLNKNFSSNSRKNGLSFGTLIYGDAYFRVRPYDVKEIAREVDRVYVMAYDFSKARGNPGPNFPLNSKSIYEYDFKLMVSDYLKDVPSHKLTFVMGMFGYDWKVDGKGRGVALASSKSTLGFEKFMTSCVDEGSCTVFIEPESKDTKINYAKGDEQHIIWFETDNSANKKIEYLNSKGLFSVGFWAYTFY